jgi:hypothetical protein
MRSVFIAILATSVAVLANVQFTRAQKIKAVRDADSANVLSIKVARNLPDGDLAEKIEKYPTGKSTLAENPDKVRQAFVFCVPSGSKEVTSCVRRVFVTDLGTDETYEISGEEPFIEAGRLINSLRWINNDTLSYERWTTPHVGHRYVVDIKKKKQTDAFILLDQ